MVGVPIIGSRSAGASEVLWHIVVHTITMPNWLPAPPPIPPTEVDRLNQKIKNLEMENLILGDIVLDTDYRLLQIEIFGLETEF